MEKKEPTLTKQPQISHLTTVREHHAVASVDDNDASPLPPNSLHCSETPSPTDRRTNPSSIARITVCSAELCAHRSKVRKSMVHHPSSFLLRPWREGECKGHATRIIGVDKKERKREKGEAFGMTDFINPSESDKSVSEMIKELTGGMGVDYCLECTGVAPLMNEALGLEATKVGKGTTILIGAGNQTMVEINFLSLLTGKTLKGSRFGGIKTKTDLPIVIDKCVNKEIQLDELLTHELPLEGVNKAFELLKLDDCVKVLIKI